ncbi:hypothetical protein [Deinococcus aquiradiocola]|uniref:Uncharacterized protein n=1 Tax=Deinococcus aquiradiocola TaxID=393059 RepID=A0A917PDP0_9DEIO|nr:hypothetical protein [Deinococcus aquiradiocola]GGJ72068.1 hypothetical protein GCM10008939_15550 [Deinococcus aquiradiocola]
MIAVKWWLLAFSLLALALAWEVHEAAVALAALLTPQAGETVPGSGYRASFTGTGVTLSGAVLPGRVAATVCALLGWRAWRASRAARNALAVLFAALLLAGGPLASVLATLLTGSAP